MSTYIDDYHRALERTTGASTRATEVITEVYVPRYRLADFMAEVAEDFRRNSVDLVYGTVRLIRRDDESFLAWAERQYACVVFNIHTPHTPAGLGQSRLASQRLIDMAIRRGGSFYLTYHRHASREQVEACYPRFRTFLKLKQSYDPEEIFQSDWYAYYSRLFDIASTRAAAADLSLS